MTGVHLATLRAIRVLLFTSLLAGIVPTSALGAQDSGVAKKLKGFDAYIEKVVRDRNVPGIGVGVVVKGKLVFAKGYGFRDYGKKLPFTSTTIQPRLQHEALHGRQTPWSERGLEQIDPSASIDTSGNDSVSES